MLKWANTHLNAHLPFFHEHACSKRGSQCLHRGDPDTLHSQNGALIDIGCDRCVGRRQPGWCRGLDVNSSDVTFFTKL